MSGLHINRFIDRLQQLELKNSKDFICPIQDAKNLHNDITRLLLRLEQQDREVQPVEQEVTVRMDGGNF
jgi:hypothetical protein